MIKATFSSLRIGKPECFIFFINIDALLLSEVHSCNTSWDPLIAPGLLSTTDTVNIPWRSNAGLAFIHRKKKILPYWQLRRQPLWGPIILFCAVHKATGHCQPLWEPLRWASLPGLGRHSRHELLFMSEVLLMTQLSNWGPQRSS